MSLVRSAARAAVWLCGIGGLGLASVAQAAPMTLSYGTSFSLSGGTTAQVSNYFTSNNPMAGLSQQGFSLQAFDGSLGTLTGVEISFTASWDHTATGYAYAQDTTSYAYSCGWSSTCYDTRYNPADVSMSGSASAAYKLDLIDPNGGQALYTSNVSVGCVNSGSGYVNCTDTEVRSGTDSGSLDINGIALSQFLADPSDSTIDFLVSIDTSAFISACQLSDPYEYCTASSNGNFNGTVSVRYRYETLESVTGSVPEPATLALVLGAALLGGVASRRRA